MRAALLLLAGVSVGAADGYALTTSRRLAMDDYAIINEMLRDVTIAIPAIETGVPIGPFNAGLRVWDLNCSNLAVGDIELASSVRPDGRVVTVAGALGEFQIACHGRWSVNMLYYEEGTINLSTQTASIGVRYEVPAVRAVQNGKSAWLELGPPLRMEDCDASLPLEIDRAEGGLIATAISNPSVESLLLGTVQGDVNRALCDALNGDIAAALSGMLDSSVAFLQPHVRRSYIMDAQRDKENREAEEAVRRLATLSNVSLVSLAYNATTGSALGGPGPLPGSSSVARSANALVWEARSAEGGRIFAVQPLLRALERVVSLAINSITGVGEVSVGASAFGSNGLFVLGGANDTRILVHFLGLTLGGLGTLALTGPTSVVGDYTLRHGFSVDDLRIELQMAMGVAPVGADTSLFAVGAGAYPMQTFTVTAGLQQLELELDAILALAENRITSLQLGTVALAPIGCLLTTIFGVIISHLALRIGDIDFPVVDGFVNAQLSAVLSALSQSVESMFEPALLAALPSVVEGLAVGPANTAIAGFLAEVPNLLPNSCPAVPPTLPDGASTYVVFGANTTGAEQLLSRALTMANEMVADDESGLSPLNDMVREVLPMPAQVLQLGGVMVELPSEFYALAHTIEVVAVNLSVWHVDTIHGVEITPADGQEHVLSAKAAIGKSAAPITIEFYAKIRLWEPAASAVGRRLSDADEVPRSSVYTTEEIRIRLGASDMRLLLQLLLMIDQQRLAAMYASEALFWQCWLAKVAPGGLRIAQLLLTLGSLDVFEVECIDCASSFFNTIADNAAAPGAKTSLHKAIQDGLDAIGAVATNDALAGLIDSAVAAAPGHCAILSAGGSVEPYRLQDAPVCAESVAVILGALICDTAAAVPWWHWIIAALVVGTALAIFLVWVGRRYLRVQQSGRNVGGRAGGVLWEQHVARTTSLFRSRAVPVFAKVCVPLVLFANAALFLTGHLAIGATVDIVLRLGDDTFNMPAYVTFSIAQSTIDMYNSGAVFLAYVVVIFSGAWPYIKLLAMLFLWFAPAYVVRPDNRGSAFAWLDTLGKWSMIDVFVMILSIVGFNVLVNPPAALDFLWEDLFSVQLLVTPRWGLYANLLAQLVSQLLSHTCLFYHRAHLAHLDALRRRVAARVGMQRGSSHEELVKTPHRVRGFLAPSADEVAPHAIRRAELAARFTETEAREAEARLPLTAHVFSVGASGRRFAVVRRGFRLALGATLAALVPLILVASVLPNISIDINGVVGLLMEAHEEGSHTRRFSIVGLGKFIATQAYEQWAPEAEAFLGVLGMWLVVVVLILCTVVAPALQCIALALLHFKRMSRSAQVHMYMAVEVITAWSYQEVYIIACVLAISQIETISRFLVECHCNDLVPIFAALHQAGVLEKEFAECFYSAASFEVAIWLLLVSGLLLSAVTQIMMRSARVAFGQQRFRQDGVVGARPWIEYWMLPGYVAFRRLCTHRLDLVDEASPPEVREAVARAMGGGGGMCGLPAYALGPWRLLWQADARRVWYWHSWSGQLCDAREMESGGPWGSTVAIAIDKISAPLAPVPALELGELTYERELELGGRSSGASTEQGSGTASPTPPGTPVKESSTERTESIDTTEHTDTEPAERPSPPPERVTWTGGQIGPADPATAPAEAEADGPGAPPPARFVRWVSEVSDSLRNQLGG